MKPSLRKSDFRLSNTLDDKARNIAKETESTTPSAVIRSGAEIGLFILEQLPPFIRAAYIEKIEQGLKSGVRNDEMLTELLNESLKF